MIDVRTLVYCGNEYSNSEQPSLFIDVDYQEATCVTSFMSTNQRDDCREKAIKRTNHLATALSRKIQVERTSKSPGGLAFRLSPPGVLLLEGF